MTLTMTRADIVDSLVKELGLTRQIAIDLLEGTLEEIIESASLEGGIKICSFGSFNIRQKAQRIGRNPKTGEEALITPRRVVTFKPSQRLKEAVHYKMASKAA